MWVQKLMLANGDGFEEVDQFKCDITGDVINEQDGWFGNENIHISENGMHLLIEDWIKSHSFTGCYPLIIEYLKKRFLKEIKPDRYIPAALRKLVLEKYQHSCVYCGATEKLEIDHIFPISKGGLSEFKNLQVLCKPCNIQKSDK